LTVHSPVPLPRYAAFLGHQPHISIAEISAALPDFTLVTTVTSTIAIFETSANLGQKDLDTWGGTMLLARELQRDAADFNDVPAMLKSEAAHVKGKVTFALRGFGIARVLIRNLYRDCKASMKQSGRPCRYVGNEFEPAATALLRDAGLIDGSAGCEFTLLGMGEDDERVVWIGRTVAAQDPDKYTKRDMEKPVRDTRVGLLPPKLAQVMLNFGRWLVAQGRKGEMPATITVFDPFCGTGVLAMESLLRHWPVLASDASLKAVNGCTKNIDWVRKEWKILKKDVSSEVWKHDARSKFELKAKPDVIVTETSLGPGLEKRPPARELAKIVKEAEELEADFLRMVAESLPGIPVVCMWPFWEGAEGPVRLEKIWTVIDKLKYSATLPPYAESASQKRLSLLYRRPDQVVGREIVMLRPPKA
jgi:hypothetical protein